MSSFFFIFSLSSYLLTFTFHCFEKGVENEENVGEAFDGGKCDGIMLSRCRVAVGGTSDFEVFVAEPTYNIK